MYLSKIQSIGMLSALLVEFESNPLKVHIVSVYNFFEALLTPAVAGQKYSRL